MRTLSKITVSLASASLLVIGLAACSASTSTDTSTSSSSPSVAADPTPLASIPALEGIDTQVTLDQAFVDALTTLSLIHI